MKFPVSFTLMFLSLSWTNALDFSGSFAPELGGQGVSRPFNRTLLSGTVSISDHTYIGYCMNTTN